MGKFSSRFKFLREEMGLTQSQLSEKLGISSSSISMYENGNREPDFELTELIADYFNVDLNYLLGASDVRNEYKAKNNTSLSNDCNCVLIEMPESVLIPVYGTISAGVPLEAIEDIDEHIDIPADWIKTGKQFIGLKIKGDSMYPKYWEGDTVVVEINPCPNSGEDCVVYVNGYEATVKQVKLYENGSIELIPKNPAYPPKIYNKGECTVVGIVREMRRKV